MSNIIFTEEEVKMLSENRYVKNVSTKAITYTDEFKRIFIAQNEKGNLPRDIFTSHGFDVNILGAERISSSAKRWRAAYRNNGVDGLRDTRKENAGRPREKEVSLEERYERLQAQNNLLKAENELLKKLDMMDRRLKRKR